MIRNIRGEVKLPPSLATDVFIIGNETESSFMKVKQNSNIISALVRTNKIEFLSKEPEAKFCSMGVVGALKIMIPLPEEFLKQQKNRLEKELEKLAGNLDKLKKQLANQEFVKNAPANLIEKHKLTLQQTEIEIGHITAKLSQWG
jgi:valyl-tRNA synthetase